MNVDYATLCQRLSIIEARLIGSSSSGDVDVDVEKRNGGGDRSGSVGAIDDGGVTRALEVLDNRVTGILTSCPDVKVCERQLVDLMPLFLGKGGGLVALAASLSEVMSKRDNILKAVENLNELKVLSAHVEVSVADIVLHRLAALESDICDMQRALDIQSQEIIEILDYYDAAMSICSEISMSWDLL